MRPWEEREWSTSEGIATDRTTARASFDGWVQGPCLGSACWPQRNRGSNRGFAASPIDSPRSWEPSNHTDSQLESSTHLGCGTDRPSVGLPLHRGRPPNPAFQNGTCRGIPWVSPTATWERRQISNRTRAATAHWLRRATVFQRPSRNSRCSGALPISGRWVGRRLQRPRSGGRPPDRLSSAPFDPRAPVGPPNSARAQSLLWGSRIATGTRRSLNQRGC